MEFKFSDDTYTGLCDTLNEIDVINLVDADVTNQEIIAMLADVIIRNDAIDVAVSGELIDAINDLAPIDGYTSEDIAQLILESELDNFIKDMRQVIRGVGDRAVTVVDVELKGTCYMVEVELVDE